jgi:hypothetical protein
MSLIKGSTYIQCPQQVMINTQKRERFTGRSILKMDTGQIRMPALKIHSSEM